MSVYGKSAISILYKGDNSIPKPATMMYNGTTVMSEWNWTFNDTPAALDYDFNNPFNKLHIRVTFCILYTLTFVCCFFGNLIVLFVIIRNARMRTRTNFFLANLAAADFCVGVFCVYPNLSMYLSPMWNLGRVMCKVYYFAHYMSLTIPVVLLSVISVERYVAILYPLKAKQLFTFKRLRVTQVLIWVILAAYNSPQLIAHDTFKLGEKTFCYIRTDNINTNAYVLANLIIWYVLPLFILSFMYCKIAAALWQSSSSQNFALNPQRNQQLTYQSDNSPHHQHHNHHHHHHHHHQSTYGNACNRTIPGAICTTGPELSRRSESIEMSALDSSGCSRKSHRLCHCGSIVSQMETEVEYMSELTDGESNSDIYSNDNGVGINTSIRTNDERVNSRLNEENQEEAANKFKRRSHNREETRRNQCKIESVCRRNNARFVTSGLRNQYPRRRPCANTQKVVQARKKVIRLLLIIIGTFAILALPYHIRACIYLWVDTKHMGSLLSPICYLLYYANSGLNPLLYAFLSGNFRKSLKDSFKCFSRK